MSMAYTPKNQVRSRHTHAAFPTLPIDEIVQCLPGLDCMVTEEELLRPTGKFVQSMYAQIATSLLGINRESMAPALAACAAGTEHPETQEDARMLFALQKPLYDLFVASGVSDYNISDILKPSPERLRVQLSAIINYARFREIREKWYEKMSEELNEEEEARTMRLKNQEEKLRRKVELIALIGDSPDQDLVEQHRINDGRKSELKRLHDQNLQLNDERERNKADLREVVSRLRHKHQLMESLREEVARLNSYVVDDPNNLQQEVVELSKRVKERETVRGMLGERVQKLDMSVDAFKDFQVDVSSCLSAFQKLNDEQEAHSKAARKITTQKELLEHVGINSRQAESRRDVLQQEIEAAESKIARIQQDMSESDRQTSRRMEGLRRQIGTLDAERALVVQQNNTAQKRLAELENDMATERDRYEAQLKMARDEAEKLQTQFREYFVEVGRRLD
ncbi:putative kinetochore protein [Yarrowia sp. C11]|nr:putative kinetochore protein [Yarrowia sp. C11]KAG5371123.1 putative kinetochore protein [Yarrowia sp. E02]